MDEVVISVNGLKKTYGSKVAINDISFSVNRQEVFGLLGPNGAGKTTTLECIETLQRFDAGTILLDGLDVVKNPQLVKQRIGVQLQATSFFDRLTPTELLEMFASFYGRKISPLKVLEEVQLQDKAKSYVEQLSGGQRQRFSIASALVNEPVVLFLDESTTGLDPQARRHLWELIREINKKKGITVVLTTHYMDEAEILCDRLAIMDNGRLVALDTPSALIKSLLSKGFKKEVEVHQANLEDVFIDLTGRALKEE